MDDPFITGAPAAGPSRSTASSLPAPRASTSSSPAASAAQIAAVGARIPGLSPPTPAPSPQPTARTHPAANAPGESSSSWRPKGLPLGADTSPFFDPASLPPPSAHSSLSSGSVGVPPSPLSECDLVSHLRAQVNALSRRAREHLLQDLLRDTAPIDLSPLYPLIVPRLQRDFLRTLPLELALHVLSFVDDARTLARASAVSRHWHALLLDESTWRRMCWKSGFVPPDPAPPLPSSSADAPAPEPALLSPRRLGTARLRTLEFGERTHDRDDALFTPAGRERRGTLDRDALEEIAARTGAYGAHHPPLVPSPGAADDAMGMDVDPAGGATGLGFGASLDGNGAHGSLAARRARPVEPLAAAFGTHAGSSASGAHPHAMEVDPALPYAVPPMPDAIQFGTIPPGPVRTPTSSQALLNGDAAVFEPAASGLSASFPPPAPQQPFSYKSHFKLAYLSEQNWVRGPGTLLSTQMSVDQGVVTSMAFDSEWIVVGMDTNKVHIFEAGLGTYVRTLAGHELGVWCLTLISKGGGAREDPPEGALDAEEDDGEGKGKARAQDPPRTPSANAFFRTDATPLAASSYSSPSSPASAPRPRRRRSFAAFDAPASPPPASGTGRRAPKPSTCGGIGVGAGGPTGDSTQQGGVCGTARGWGQEGAVVVSGGSDRNVRVWDVATGRCLHVLPGHTSTVRCLRVLDGRPIAVSGSRDGSIRVWDIARGLPLRLLSGHRKSVRAIEVCGNRIVSGSYDTTARLWDVDTGECLHVFRGHIGEIYSVAFDGVRVITGSLDSTVRVWSAETGEFLALLQGHTLLVGQMQLDPYADLLVTAGSDGFVMVFSLATYEPLHRIKAHSQSVTSLQFDERFIVTGGNDGRLKLWDTKTGAFLRDLSEPCDTVWRALVRDDKLVSLSRRDDRILMDVKTFREPEPSA
ncbi:hypothetical protein JCM10450v2_003594 [Rhodotorula kratochvilovae]